ncbi:MAG: complement resistance protein TraT [Desulfovibrio sp.]|uniref:complement resistance protein TraT n=1 Tax=Desulfovibrio sp. TaxID=885 RepID=UPI0025BD398E|nr:complement resistance protein TraT [Desulfovibrio sp.]MCI7569935.1 complement resistance protein TraT [Desulfovibrio sp.]
MIKRFRNPLGWTVLLLGVLCGACIRPHTPPSMQILQTGSLEAQGGPGVARTVYVDARDALKPAPVLRDAIVRRLTGAGFKVIDSPSKAGHILHVNVVAAGECDAGTARAAIDAGFDSPVRLQGGGSVVIVADALLVERNVPSPHKARSNAMRSITRRNALADSRLRLGIILPHIDRSPLVEASVADRLAQELCRPLETADKQGQEKD